MIPTFNDANVDPFAPPSDANRPISVGTLLQRARNALDRALPLCWVAGEISGFKRASSGHCYFDLKDADAQIACVLYRTRSALVGFDLKDGAQVELRVRPAIYEPRGSLQFTVEQARLAGVGRLYEAFLRLKAKLESEGLFAPERKRELPRYPLSIGLITSPQAAALADMLRILRERWPVARVVLYPASVQGVNAPRELLAALERANERAECDVLIIGRGGGSMEDLWAFNDEALVRAVAASTLPIISAVGHETDFTLCDFAADHRAPTPTAAAALAAPDLRTVLAGLDAQARRLHGAMTTRWEQLSERLDRNLLQLRASASGLRPWREAVVHLQGRWARALDTVRAQRRERLTAFGHALRAIRLPAPALTQTALLLGQRQQTAMRDRLREAEHRLARAGVALSHLNPEQVLERGYALVYDERGAILGDQTLLASGAALVIRTRRRRIDATVAAVTPVEPNADPH